MIRVLRGHPIDYLSYVALMCSSQRPLRAMTGACGPYNLGGSATGGLHLHPHLARPSIGRGGMRVAPRTYAGPLFSMSP
jgi:hypothetical protein